MSATSPSPAYSLRPATAGDRPAMADLWVASWVKTLPEIDFEARRPWLDSHLDELAAGGALIRVAAAEGQLAGFVVIHPGTGYLDQIAVGPTFWGRGAAEALMAEAKAISPSLVALDVNQENPRAVRFYEKMGLAITGEGENSLSGRRTFRMEWRP
ncbi:N-acetyltransferase family protein [Xanthobacter sp. ZOL 2024]